MTEVKICGVCLPGDARVAADAGAAYVGVILAAGGPRERTAEQAAAIWAAAPGAGRAGVFADRPAGEVIALARALDLDVVQLHGAEGADIVAQVADAGPWLVWKAVRPQTAAALAAARTAWGDRVDALLVDGAAPGALGGTGVRAPWDALAPSRWTGAPRFVLAGGLRPENVAGAVTLLRPDVVDVSSGVEETPGRKSEESIRAFVRAAHAASGAGRQGTLR